MSSILSISVEQLTGETTELEVDSSETVLDLKTLIEDETGIPVSQQRLIFNGEALADDSTLEKCGMMNQSVIYLVPAPPASSVIVECSHEPCRTTSEFTVRIHVEGEKDSVDLESVTELMMVSSTYCEKSYTVTGDHKMRLGPHGETTLTFRPSEEALSPGGVVSVTIDRSKFNLAGVTVPELTQFIIPRRSPVKITVEFIGRPASEETKVRAGRAKNPLLELKQWVTQLIKPGAPASESPSLQLEVIIQRRSLDFVGELQSVIEASAGLEFGEITSIMLDGNDSHITPAEVQDLEEGDVVTVVLRS